MAMPWDRHPDDERPRTEAEEREYREGMETIIARRDHFNGQYDKHCLWVAMRRHDFENIDYDTPAGRGATPLEAVEDLFWRLDLEDETPYCLKILDGGSNGQA